jgi:hypothetical protein
VISSVVSVWSAIQTQHYYKIHRQFTERERFHSEYSEHQGTALNQTEFKNRLAVLVEATYVYSDKLKTALNTQDSENVWDAFSLGMKLERKVYELVDDSDSIICGKNLEVRTELSSLARYITARQYVLKEMDINTLFLIKDAPLAEMLRDDVGGFRSKVSECI